MNVQLKSLKALSSKVAKIIAKHRLIEPNDRIIIGLSGGNDSYVALDVFAFIHKKSPFPFEMKAIHVIIKEAGYKADLDFMTSFCEQRNIPLEILELSVDITKNPDKSPCYAYYINKWI